MQRPGPRTLKNFIRHSGTGTFRSSDFGMFRAGFLSKVKLGSHCQVLGDVQKRMTLFDAELKDARKLTEKMQQETSVAV